MDKLSLLQREPVRVYLYSVFVAVVALAVGTGVITGGLAPLVLGAVAAVLAVPSVEGARASVLPVAKLEQGVVRNDLP